MAKREQSDWFSHSVLDWKVLVLSTDSCAVPVTLLLFVHIGDPASQSSLRENEEKELEAQIHISEYPLFVLCNGESEVRTQLPSS